VSIDTLIDSAVTVDFETEAIAQYWPEFPPEPVGVAIRWVNGDEDYLAWGHPKGNNCTKREAKRVLESIWSSNAPVLFHNAKFDLHVAYERMGLDPLPWDRVHDTMFLAFLLEPHSKSLALKELAEEWLDWPPEERDVIADYVWKHRKRLVAKHGGNITKAKSGPNSAGAWISKCPAGLVGKYAIGDVGRTWGLFQTMLPIVDEYRMVPSYDRTRRVMPIFMENERDGIHVDIEALERDVPRYEAALEQADDLLRSALDAPDLNIASDAQLADALSDSGCIDDDDWTLTKTGLRSVSKDNLKFEMFKDRHVARLFFYRNKVQTTLSTFLRPWEAQAKQRGGIISTVWNQVRSPDGGARTGRPSTSNPNFLNIPKDFKASDREKFDFEDGNEWGLPPLPNVRAYVLPDPGHVFCHRDFDGQEMRAFAHVEQGPLLEAYQADPDLDPHGWVRDEVEKLVGVALDRTPVKILNFQGLYGGGVPAAQKALNAALDEGCTMADAKRFKKFHDTALPGRIHVNDVIKEIIDEGDPIRTWGGRCYFCEEPRLVDGRIRHYLYKLINYYCQGSAADITYEALIRWYEDPRRHATTRFLVTVYDEINISCHEDLVEQEMLYLLEAMEGVVLDLLMRSSGKVGDRWGNLESYDDKREAA